MTTFRWYLVGLALLFAAYVAVEYYRPKPLNWTPTYQNKDKIPYGTFVLHDQLPHVLAVPAREVYTVRVPIYNQLEGREEPRPNDDAATALDSADIAEMVDQAADTTRAGSSGAASDTTAAAPALIDSADTTDADYAAGLAESGYKRASYLFVNGSFSLSRLDCRSLLRHAARGNDVFIAAENFDLQFADTLGFRSVSTVDQPNPKDKKLQLDSVRLRFTNAALQKAAGTSAFRLPALTASYHLVPDSSRAEEFTVLATDARNRPVLVRRTHGRGHVYLCSVPVAFSNYYVLRPRTHGFAFAALSYLPTGRLVWWDEYQKQGRVGEQSLLRVLMAHDALRWATYLALLGALLFMVFEAKRRQRVIPILKPLPNTTLLFTRTVAGLYRQGRNHQLIAEKKIGLFLEHLRTQLHEPTLDLQDEALRERLSQKSGVARPEVDALVRRINFALTSPQLSDVELLALNRALNDFRRAMS
ncbi:DUF4350 domain-containing protein [Hymenobacter guriensis]|uniref:DUF4350 domain-containing protein n=1 Tax=Hymenobacter guriensis TaxID=2793065 RepID=A0ABS0L5N1_9BACT|nr:DUF4350 domain-containing protein [Hymenobacter guriensis]MBG8555381.1 hypothetical protein [Hymenobacter guriensis]